MRYRTIVADPPWDYAEGHIRTAATGRDHNTAEGQGDDIRRALPYPSMSVAAIRALPVRALANDDARLFLWTTNRYLPTAFGVLEAWDFTYRQTLVWHKAEGGQFPASIAPNTAEYLIVATRGKPPRTGFLPSTVLKIAAPREHSVKPEAFLDFVEAVSPGPYLELFARRQRLGWDTWGDQALEHVALQSGGTT